MPSKFLTRMLCALTLMAWFPASAAETVDRIAAVVNDEIITVRELDEHIRLALASLQQADTIETRKRLSSQLLDKIIEQHLVFQEARRLKQAVDQREVDAHIRDLEQQNHLPPGGLAKEVERMGISVSILQDQYRKDTLWQRLLLGMFGSSIVVGDEEIRERLEAIAARRGSPEYMVAEIYLSVPSLSQEEQVHNLANRLVQQIKEGTPFTLLASQFSQAPSAGNGGGLGWVTEGVMDDELFALVKTMAPGSLTNPVRLADGYHILALVNRRMAGTGVPGSESTITYSDMLLPVPPKDAPPTPVLLNKALSLLRTIHSCDEFEALGRREAATGIERHGPLKLSTLPESQRYNLLFVAPNETAMPTEIPGKGIQVSMMCQRTDTLAPLPKSEEIRREIEFQRLGMMGQRLMRDLRRSAYIDIRL